MRSAVDRPPGDQMQLLSSDARSDQKVSMADEMRNARVGIREEQLRGVEVKSLVAGAGYLFAEAGAAAREDPAGTYAHSEAVQRLDFFISHAWRSSRIAKYLALLSYFNLSAAVTAWIMTAFMCFWYATLYFESLAPMFVLPPQPKFIDDVSLRCCFFVQLFAPIAFFLVFVFGHHALRRGERAFLDIACIDQLDSAKKAAGIQSLGALLDRSQRMVVLLDEHNMQRMWCVFELAAFAKRGSLARIDVVPLHLALQQAAIIALMVLVPMVGIFGSMDYGSETGSFGFMLVMLPLMALPFLLLVQSTYDSRLAVRKIEGLRSFSLADAQCYSQVDREAITEIIGRWFADGESVKVGVHNFEMFVRRDVHDKVAAAVGSGMFQWPPILGLLLWLAQVLPWFLDEVAVPECTLWHVVSAMGGQLVLPILFYPLVGFGLLATAAAMEHAISRWRWPAGWALGVLGLPGGLLTFISSFAVLAIGTPFSFYTNTDTAEGRMRFPDDGLEPFARRVIKVQVVAVLACLLVGIGMVFLRDGGR